MGVGSVSAVLASAIPLGTVSVSGLLFGGVTVGSSGAHCFDVVT